MTNEEAIKKLKAYMIMECENMPTQVGRAYDMAIAALREKQEREHYGDDAEGRLNAICEQCQIGYSDRLFLRELLRAYEDEDERENQKPLTLDELREMDGEPAYFQFGDGAQGWAVIEWQTESGTILYGTVADDHSEPDVDFINMEYDDPDGYFGLHLLGWRAYRYKPKEAQS